MVVRTESAGACETWVETRGARRPIGTERAEGRAEGAGKCRIAGLGEGGSEDLELEQLLPPRTEKPHSPPQKACA